MSNQIPRKKGKNGTYLDLYPGSGYDPTVYERPTYTVDMCIFRVFNGVLQILAIRRGQDPFKGKLAFPGGFVDIRNRESSEEAAIRELAEETGVKGLKGLPQQFRTYSNHDRDPRWHTVTTVYYYLMRKDEWERMPVRAGDDAAEATWVDAWKYRRRLADKLSDFGFDHHKVLCNLLDHLLERSMKDGLFFLLTDEESFTMPELRRVYTALKGMSVDAEDAGNFQKQIQMRFRLERETQNKTKPPGKGRPAARWTLL